MQTLVLETLAFEMPASTQAMLRQSDSNHKPIQTLLPVIDAVVRSLYIPQKSTKANQNMLTLTYCASS